MAEIYREFPHEPPELQVNRIALGKARKKRWASLLSTFPTPRLEILEWAGRMAKQHGPKVGVRRVVTPNQVVDWVTALYIVRYGENEAYWPSELTEDDVRRALDWENGHVPPIVDYLEEEE